MRDNTDSIMLGPSTVAINKPRMAPERYGWIMVGISFLVQAVGSGNQYMTVLLIQPLKNTLHASSAAVLLATTSALTLVVAVASPLCGIIVQRYSIRKFIIIAFAAVAVGYVGLAYAAALWQVGVIYALAFSIGVLASTLAANTLVSNWFVAQRGLALGIASAGVHAAGCIIPPLATYSIERFGLIATCFATACVITLLLPMVGWLVIDKPESRGFTPHGSDNYSAIAVRREDRAAAAWTLRRLFLSSRFWIISALGALASGVGSVLMINLMELAQAAHIDRLTSSYFVSCEAIGAIVGAVAFGRIFDAMSQRDIALCAIALSAVPCLLLLGQPDQWRFGIASVLVGLSLGAALLAPNVLIAINFGRSGFAVALGAMNFFIMLVLVIGMPLFGAVYDRYRSYDLALHGCLMVLAFTLMAAYFLPGRQR